MRGSEWDRATRKRSAKKKRSVARLTPRLKPFSVFFLIFFKVVVWKKSVVVTRKTPPETLNGTIMVPVLYVTSTSEPRLGGRIAA